MTKRSRLHFSSFLPLYSPLVSMNFSFRLYPANHPLAVLLTVLFSTLPSAIPPSKSSIHSASLKTSFPKGLQRYDLFSFQQIFRQNIFKNIPLVKRLGSVFSFLLPISVEKRMQMYKLRLDLPNLFFIFFRKCSKFMFQ